MRRLIFILLIPYSYAFSLGITRRTLLYTTALSTSLIDKSDKPSVFTIQESESSSSGGAGVERLRNKIHFNGEVSVQSCNEIRKALDEAGSECKIVQSAFDLLEPPPIELHIQSTGGSLMPALNLADIITASDVPVHSYVEGFAASAATLLTVVCKKRFIRTHGTMLLHQLSSGAQGKLSMIEEEVQNLRLFNKIIKDIYLDKTNIAPDKIDELLKHDIWFTAQECLEKGIVDAIL